MSVSWPSDADSSTVTSSSSTSLPSYTWEEKTGLLSSLIPQSGGSEKRSVIDASAYNLSKGELKLGPAPINEDLQNEVERVYREQVSAGAERELFPQDMQLLRLSAPPSLTSPQSSDMPPLPPSFKTVDVKREVERIRDARKKIKLDPSALTPLEKDSTSSQATAARARALPSICCYTLHDVGDGYAYPCSTSSVFR